MRLCGSRSEPLGFYECRQPMYTTARLPSEPLNMFANSQVILLCLLLQKTHARGLSWIRRGSEPDHDDHAGFGSNCNLRAAGTACLRGCCSHVLHAECGLPGLRPGKPCRLATCCCLKLCSVFKALLGYLFQKKFSTNVTWHTTLSDVMFHTTQARSLAVGWPGF